MKVCKEAYNFIYCDADVFAENIRHIYITIFAKKMSIIKIKIIVFCFI